MISLVKENDLIITEDLTRYGRSMVLMLVEINKLLEMGLPVNQDNVDWYKLQVMSKNLTSLTQTGGVR